jgi:positive regulator of sigma E activity
MAVEIPIPKEVLQRAWLLFEWPILIILLALLLGYNSFDESGRLLTRGFLVFVLAVFWVAAVHNVVVTRIMTTNQGILPRARIPILFLGLRLILLWIYIFWLIQNGIVAGFLP